jgi:iron(II)-dependent oxidoreductase
MRTNNERGQFVLYRVFELGLDRTCAVGIFLKGSSPYGCLDMAGQVLEWTATLWQVNHAGSEYRYPYDPVDGRERLDGGGLRVLRGGSFSVSRNDVRCAWRSFSYARRSYNNVGFRIVVSPMANPREFVENTGLSV